MKLKWYDWDGEGDIPVGITGVRYSNMREFGFSGREGCHSSIIWRDHGMCMDTHDIIAYTLGEPLEKDSILTACDKVIANLDNMTKEELQAEYDKHENGPIGQAIEEAQEFLYGEPLEVDDHERLTHNKNT